MLEELLPFYQRELTALQELGSEFAQRYPNIAGNLGLTEASEADPHISRLIESCAFMNARISHKLSDDFPEVTDALLEILYPHYQKPIPGMLIAQFNSQPDLAVPYQIPRHTRIETIPDEGDTVQFQSCYDTTLLPIRVQLANLMPYDQDNVPKLPQGESAQGCLRLVLECLDKDLTFAQLKPTNLRFFLKGLEQHTFPLYELLCSHTVNIAFTNSFEDPHPIWIKPQHLRPVGFAENEGLLPYSARSALGYRLMTEFFAFPEKFLFVELANVPLDYFRHIGNKLEIFIYLNQAPVVLQKNITASHFVLGCTPLINLFQRTAEPIVLSHTVSEYPVIPDVRRATDYGVYSIERVQAVDAQGQADEYEPFYSIRYSTVSKKRKTFWTTSRRLTLSTQGHKTDLSLSLVDSEFTPLVSHDQTLHIQVTCFNNETRTAFNRNQVQLQLVEDSAPLVSIYALTPLSAVIQPPLRNRAHWNLISHLALNHVSLFQSRDSVTVLKEIIQLYNFPDSEKTAAFINGIQDMKMKRITRRILLDGLPAFVQGLEVSIVFDEQYFTGRSLWLFASVLEQFLAQYISMNAFIEFVAITPDEKLLHRWPPRAGNQFSL